VFPTDSVGAVESSGRAYAFVEDIDEFTNPMYSYQTFAVEWPPFPGWASAALPNKLPPVSFEEEEWGASTFIYRRASSQSNLCCFTSQGSNRYGADVGSFGAGGIYYSSSGYVEFATPINRARIQTHNGTTFLNSPNPEFGPCRAFISWR